jgi:hypothetical protein
MFGLYVDGFKWARFNNRDTAEAEARRELGWSSVMAAWVEEIGPLDHGWDSITVMDREV